MTLEQRRKEGNADGKPPQGPGGPPPAQPPPPSRPPPHHPHKPPSKDMKDEKPKEEVKVSLHFAIVLFNAYANISMQ